MKYLSIVIGSILLLLNAVMGLMFSGYHTYNCILNSIIIVVSAIILYLVSSINLKDGYRVSFNCLFPLFTIIELVCGGMAAEQIKNNICILAILLLIILQVVLLVLCNYLSNKTNEYEQK